MAAQLLVGPDLSGGERLLTELDREHLPIITAFWLYPTSESDWRLMISSPLVDTEGSLPVYQRIQAVLQRLPEIHISLSVIVAVGAHDPVIRHLRLNMPPNVAPDNIGMTLTLPNYAPFSSSLADHEGVVRVYVYRLIPSGSATESAV